MHLDRSHLAGRGDVGTGAAPPPIPTAAPRCRQPPVLRAALRRAPPAPLRPRGDARRRRGRGAARARRGGGARARGAAGPPPWSRSAAHVQLGAVRSGAVVRGSRRDKLSGQRSGLPPNGNFAPMGMGMGGVLREALCGGWVRRGCGKRQRADRPSLKCSVRAAGGGPRVRSPRCGEPGVPARREGEGRGTNFSQRGGGHRGRRRYGWGSGSVRAWICLKKGGAAGGKERKKRNNAAPDILCSKSALPPLSN